jgi:predicted DsbA family dithiol-disulfide isomerase
MDASPNDRKLTIDVISDVVCPWCFIGRRRLGAALALLAQRRADVVPLVSWHPFQLNPELPREGVDRRAYLEAKFGSAGRIELVRERIGSIGNAVGIEFEFDRIAVQPNTLDAHRLVSWAQARGGAEDVLERLFRAYFLEGRNVGDRAVLAGVAGESGLDRDEASAMLASGELREEIAAMDRRVRELGVDGVPFFIFDGKVAVSGAQEPEALVDAMLQSLDDAGA